MEPATPRSHCQQALAIFAERVFSRWQGLPAGCVLADVFAQFERLNEGVGAGTLGEAREEAQFTMLRVPGYAQPVRVWFRGVQVVLLDAEYPEIAPGEIEALGEPAVRLDYTWGRLQLEGGQHVWPDRGLALFVNPDNGALIHLSAFTPTSLEHYAQSLMLGLRTERLRHSG